MTRTPIQWFPGARNYGSLYPRPFDVRAKCSFVTISEATEVNSMIIPTIFLLLGGEIDYVRKDWGHFYQITAVAYYHISDMISDGGLMKSFAGFLRVVVVRWLSECSWRSVVGFFRQKNSY